MAPLPEYTMHTYAMHTEAAVGMCDEILPKVNPRFTIDWPPRGTNLRSFS